LDISPWIYFSSHQINMNAIWYIDAKSLLVEPAKVLFRLHTFFCGAVQVLFCKAWCIFKSWLYFRYHSRFSAKKWTFTINSWKLFGSCLSSHTSNKYWHFRSPTGARCQKSYQPFWMRRTERSITPCLNTSRLGRTTRTEGKRKRYVEVFDIAKQGWFFQLSQYSFHLQNAVKVETVYEVPYAHVPYFETIKYLSCYFWMRQNNSFILHWFKMSNLCDLVYFFAGGDQRALRRYSKSKGTLGRIIVCYVHWKN